MSSKLLDTIRNKKPEGRMAYWMAEREMIRIRRHELGFEKPWTKDPILQSYKFCNVRREHDTVTQWIRINWRDPHKESPDIWFPMMVARMINWPDTLNAIGYPLPWDIKAVRKAMKLRQADGLKVFTGAYMVSNGGRSDVTKIEYVTELLDKAWRTAEEPPILGDSLASAYAKLCDMQGLGSFMAAQIVADLKHTVLLEDARDWWTWAARGPGSERGLNRALNKKVTRGDWYEEARKLYFRVLPMASNRVPGLRGLDMQDFQNCLCEFDKYERVLWGEGRPRSLYPGV